MSLDKSYPAISILPSLKGKIPVIHLIVVDLPAPLLPIKPNTSPSFTVKLKLLTAYLSAFLYFFDKLLIVIITAPFT